MTQVQTSIGTGSLGLIYRDVIDADLADLIEKCAIGTGQSVGTVTDKLAQGYTMWLDRSAGQKIRGYDAKAVAQRANQQAADRAQARAADGYFNHQ
jgi:hypothetical protein